MKKYYINQGGKEFATYIKRRKATWIGHILRRNCLIKHVSEGKIEGVGRGGRRRKDLLDNLKEMIRYWKLTEGALDLALCKRLRACSETI
jgi:hypothetical protein